MSNLRSKVIRLAYQKPELRKHLLPLVKEAKTAAKSVKYMCFTEGVQDDISAALYRQGIEYKLYHEVMFGSYIPHIEIFADSRTISKILNRFKGEIKKVAFSKIL